MSAGTPALELLRDLHFEASFANLGFILAFLPIVLAAYWLLPRPAWRRAWLVLASLTFYSFWDVRFAPLLVVASLFDFAIALKMSSSPHPKRWLVASIVVNLGVLAFFKYTMFALDNARSLFSILGLDVSVPYAAIVLPVGISFYTFQTMSYVIDVYRGTVAPTRDIVKYLAFVTLFPQLVAGPIVRYAELDKQLDNIPLRLDRTLLATGLALFAVGLFKKVAIADSLAIVVDPIWSSQGALSIELAWLAAVGYSLQLYFDFSGYSTMAIGLGFMLGFRFPQNFDAPYQARDPSDFWRRWHITLGSFLRDYLYVPLGGSRGARWRVAIALFVVMTLGGLWHGAAWTFVAWGVYHGLLLVSYHTWKTHWDKLPALLRQGAMAFLVILGWVLFRAGSFPAAARVYRGMFAGIPGAIGSPVAITACGMLLIFLMWARPVERRSWRFTPLEAGAIGATLAGLIFLLGRGESPFLYYQF